MQDALFESMNFWQNRGLGRLVFENGGIEMAWRARLATTRHRTSIEGARKNRLYVTLNFELGERLRPYVQN